MGNSPVKENNINNNNRHRRTISIGCSEKFKEWNMPDYEILRLSRILVKQPRLKPLVHNDLYLKRMQRSSQIQTCN
ncbi:hypothetical protein SteCoe_14005 [Stentor coeruleus]|uniref:Uncharacterized protein n=1 Tax=Stentor coeruleus TaxID=5963 RepID=A0A1R2C735_9CILI|nr:hypothetical protein SteCoe_14005 [Stentor coeruleus]